MDKKDVSNKQTNHLPSKVTTRLSHDTWNLEMNQNKYIRKD